MQTWINTFLVVLAAIFPVVNPPGTALVFIGLTSGFTPHIRRTLALRVAINSLLVLVCSFLLGALILQFYGISISVLRAAGGFIVAVSGWNLLNRGSHKAIEASRDAAPVGDPLSLAFYPLTLPLTTGPGTIAVVISIGISRTTFSQPADELLFIFASLAAVTVIAFAIWLCFSYADRIRRVLGQGGTDIAVRLTAFILFTLGVQILWSGLSELLISVIHPDSIRTGSKPMG
ncbi:MarC family protein [Bosea sp. NBC_00550]|jgi:multiple antibiotic resistance protein|uniref:MarC family protein n=1 Tax=Bosea sp. NBC_00550 TaxID=2969621 RepID=UPI00222E7495|nr:NAAT family transporter [Bosea sp. NBC_00550]UZF95668.1 NAAT family transporter [Bosea sp. NBC_00550]